MQRKKKVLQSKILALVGLSDNGPRPGSTKKYRNGFSAHDIFIV